MALVQPTNGIALVHTCYCPLELGHIQKGDCIYVKSGTELFQQRMNFSCAAK